MKRYKLIIAYDGTNYNGWQMQPNLPTIVGFLQERFYTVFKTSAQLMGASRTDAGVHALGQVAECRTDIDLEPEQLCFAWNNTLSPDIVIRSLEKAEPSFHPHKNVAYKIYYYHLFKERPLPFVQRYGWFFRSPINFEKLTQGLNVFVGTHDFRSFCTGDARGSDTIRTINSASITYFKRFNLYRIAIQGPSFLRYMIRRIVGACLEVASHPDLSINVLRETLAKKDPHHLLPNAPAKGLLLYKIVYKKN